MQPKKYYLTYYFTPYTKTRTVLRGAKLRYTAEKILFNLLLYAVYKNPDSFARSKTAVYSRYNNIKLIISRCIHYIINCRTSKYTKPKKFV